MIAPPPIETIAAMVQRTAAARAARPRATYRLQFTKGIFGFRDAAAVTPYLAQLGVSHVYASPYLKARSGAPHGYAVVDYGQLDPELGTAEDYEAWTAALHVHGLGQILDIVPNHMSASPENPWWNDVLENGPSSPYADFFDIDWHPPKRELAGRLLLPILGRQFGQSLEAGELQVVFRDGAFFIQYFDTVLPAEPKSYAALLTPGLDALRNELGDDAVELRELESLLTAIHHLPDRKETAPERIRERQREKEVIKDRLGRLAGESPRVAAFLAANLERLNGRPEEPESFDRLEHLLDQQVYRLSHWKAAADEINYRRFFDVNELAAVCMEDRRLFEASHAFVFELLAEGKLDGLRVDHVDGLFDPLEYLARLQWGYLRALGRRAYDEYCAAKVALDTPAVAEEGGGAGNVPPAWEEIEAAVLAALWPHLGGPPPWQLLGFDPPAEAETGAEAMKNCPLYVLVEKILGPEEPLPRHWPVAGTTGYDFLNFVGGLFVDPRGLAELNKLYGRFTRESVHFHDVAYRCKLLILQVSMASELVLLANRLNRISEHHRLSRDFTLNTLRTALREILASFPVYRTYIGSGGIDDRDREVIGRAVAIARRRHPAMDAAVFDFLRGVLLLEQPPKLDAAGLREREFFVGRFQQVTSPVMAKGVEDTAFYRYCPLVSTNEVGGEPARAAVSLERFHEENLWRQAHYPAAMLCTSTHDTKRSEDVRARINVLAEVPHLWRAAVHRWARLNRRHHREVHGAAAPSRADEYLFYQTLVGVWPLEPVVGERHAELVERLVQYMSKATHEAKRHTSWVSPAPDYDAAVEQFVRTVLRDEPRNRFLPDLRALNEQIVDSGLYSALSQVLLKMTSPGVPDLYQGQELWDFSLVDPDNRRPVDFSQRQWLLGELRHAVEGGRLRELAAQLAAAPRDNRLKLFVTWRCLEFRRRQGGAPQELQLVPLDAEGSRSQHACAFAWQPVATPGTRGQTPDTPMRRSGEKDGAWGASTAAIVIAPRLIAQLGGVGGRNPSLHPADPAAWQDTTLTLPPPLYGAYRSWFTGGELTIGSAAVPLPALLDGFPVALWSPAA